MPPAQDDERVDLTIIMPVFNESATVDQAIRAILELDLPVASRELIVVDDGSTDDTSSKLNSTPWPPRFG